MKKIIIIFVILFVLLLINIMPVCSIESPNEDSLRLKFAEAEQTFSSFTQFKGMKRDNLDFDISITRDNIVYYKIIKGPMTMDSLEKYLLTLFSPEITEMLLDMKFDSNNKSFIEINGELYYDIAGMQNPYNVGVRNFKIKESTASKIIYSLEYEVSDGDWHCCTQYVDYELELNDEGNWIFKSFVLPVSLFHYPEYHDNPITADVNLAKMFIPFLLIFITTISLSKTFLRNKEPLDC